MIKAEVKIIDDGHETSNKPYIISPCNVDNRQLGNGLYYENYSFRFEYAKIEEKEEFRKAILPDGQYCWQICCETEMCKQCSRLENGETDYFDNTFSND